MNEVTQAEQAAWRAGIDEGREQGRQEMAALLGYVECTPCADNGGAVIRDTGQCLSPVGKTAIKLTRGDERDCLGWAQRPQPVAVPDELNMDAVLSMADVHAVESLADGVRHFDRGGLYALAKDIARAALAATPAAGFDVRKSDNNAAAPAVLPEPDAAIKEVMELVSDVVQEATHEGCDKAEKALRDRLRALLATGGQAQAETLAIPSECPHLIWYDDQERRPELFAGSGARTAAARRFAQISQQWNAHLFVRVDKNSRDCLYPVATVAAPQAQDVERGEVLVTVSGFTGSGKSAIAGEIEILCRALGLQVDWPDGDPEKNMTHADWTAALEQYKPRVHIVEQNIPFAAMKGMSK